jgi:hypothetical protein
MINFTIDIEDFLFYMYHTIISYLFSALAILFKSLVITSISLSIHATSCIKYPSNSGWKDASIIEETLML